jgi:hypothetical protein
MDVILVNLPAYNNIVLSGILFLQYPEAHEGWKVIYF